MRLMPEQEVVAAKTHRCGFCGHAIPEGETHLKYRAFDPDLSRDGGKTWGAWIEERWHIACRRPESRPVIQAETPGDGAAYKGA